MSAQQQTATTNTNRKFSLTGPWFLLRLEGAVLLVAAVLLFNYRDGNWLLFALLLLAPDLSALGYLAGTKVGATTYNLVHTELFPALLTGYGFVGGNQLAVACGLIWFAHIGMDRLLGFGLKYPTVFQDTHLNHV